MCSRYYIDDETSREIEKLLKLWSEKGGKEAARGDLQPEIACLSPGDIHPAEIAPILSAQNGRLGCKLQRWGFPGYAGSGKSGAKIIFNARQESALEKPTFRDSILHRRLAVPAAQFYEWNQNKEKNTFYRKDQPVMYLAGCYRCCQDGEHFVILTTAANDSMKPVHDRMPLILEQEEVAEWILDDRKIESFLQKMPCQLERRTEYEQMSLFL